MATRTGSSWSPRSSWGWVWPIIFWNYKLLLEADVKWINWNGANGYDDFGWGDQWVFAVGAQYQPIQKLFLRMGYNYGENPVNEHNGWNGHSLTTVQGNTMPRYYYETFRMIGFPGRRGASHHRGDWL